MESIILASGSLRRQEYFRLLGLPFSIMPSLIDESPEKGRTPEELAGDLAVKKVKKVVETLKDRLPAWICGADTIISVDGEVYGKPKDREDAGNMLRRLGGREHEVFTAVALYNGKAGTMDCRTVSSTVVFAGLSENEIEWYLNTGEWQGVAGAYRIQGLASCFISSIKGSFSAIVGLPMYEFYAMLRDSGYPYGG
ncbi:MAG: Maf family protein [Treponema sp.]|jgi:septum formation protein|nr:Maf family protein [Treponema sp.]